MVDQLTVAKSKKKLNSAENSDNAASSCEVTDPTWLQVSFWFGTCIVGCQWYGLVPLAAAGRAYGQKSPYVEVQVQVMLSAS